MLSFYNGKQVFPYTYSAKTPLSDYRRERQMAQLCPFLKIGFFIFFSRYSRNILSTLIADLMEKLFNCLILSMSFSSGRVGKQSILKIERVPKIEIIL